MKSWEKSERERAETGARIGEAIKTGRLVLFRENDVGWRLGHSTCVGGAGTRTIFFLIES